MSRAGAWVLAIAVAGLTLALTPTSASAATCADHPNQASAQRAKDTRDADADGIYCEALPCPCLKPGDPQGGGGSRPAPRRRPRAKPRPRATTIAARITAVVDGDTVKVRTSAKRSYTVRLIGIDTPETKKPGTAVECGGREATASMLGLAFSAPRDSDGDGLLDQAGGEGRQVRLTTDPTQDRFDRYRRLLAYVRTSGTFINEAQVASGWASVYVYQGKAFRELGRLRGAQGVARAAGRGVWGKCSGDFHRPAASSFRTNGAATPVAGCSRRVALTELRRRGKVPRRGRYRLSGGVIDRFVCADLTGDGRPDMAVTITYGGSGGAVQWAVLTRTSTGGWAIPIIRRETHTGLRQEGAEFAVLHPIYRRGDPNCCPTGGYRYRRFGWDGSRFVLRAEQVLEDIPPGFYR